MIQDARHQWLTPEILATQKAEGKDQEDCSSKPAQPDLILKIPNTKRAGGVGSSGRALA
jgi:hypothetical protein